MSGSVAWTPSPRRIGSQRKIFALNGADYATWNPTTDKLLPKTYKASNVAGKKACKAELLKTLDRENYVGTPAGAPDRAAEVAR